MNNGIYFAQVLWCEKKIVNTMKKRILNKRYFRKQQDILKYTTKYFEKITYFTIIIIYVDLSKSL